MTILNVWRKAVYNFRKKIPRSLYNRTLIIVVAPVILVQLVVTLAFLERNFQRDTRLLSAATAADISAFLMLYEKSKIQGAIEDVLVDLERLWSLDVQLLEENDRLNRLSRPLFSFNERILLQQLRDVLKREVIVQATDDPSLVAVDIELGHQKIMRILVRKSRVYASNYHIILLWMLSTAVISLVIAVLFLRNQIRPLAKLADAAERFGRGCSDVVFQSRGATEIRQVGAAFLNMKERIEQFMNQRIMLLNGVSHDLNTLLTRFKLSLALLPEAPGVDDLVKDVDVMEKILKDYLDFSRDGGGQEALLTVSIKNLLDDALKSFKGWPIRITIDCENETVCSVRPTAFHRLLLNILGNGARYGKHIHIAVHDYVNGLAIAIHDDGPGIPEALYDEAFMPFSRLDSGRDLEGGHSGLGLTIARDIARSHGGDVILGRSSFGGALVTIQLPT